MALNESLLDADRAPMIQIKTDPVSSSNKTRSRIMFWIQKNMLLTLTILIACCLTFIFIKQSTYSTASEKIFLSLRSKLFHPVHQNKLRVSATTTTTTTTKKYLEPDTFLDWSRVTNASSKVKGAFVAVAREEELFSLRATMLGLEKRFNGRYEYPWIIIGSNVFSSHFREMITHATKAPVSFGLAPSIEWQEPYWIDIKRVEKRVKEMSLQDIEKGESLYWRKMTRYNMGFLAFHPLLKDLEFYWKVQPGSNYHCDIPHDPFERLKKEKKKLSFALTGAENHQFIQDLDIITKNFIRKHKNSLQPVSDGIYKALIHEGSDLKKSDGLGQYTGHYSNCMIYNNFMIASLDFLRSKEYNLFFDELDASGGFFYERWGDSLPQTLAVSLFLKSNEIVMDDLYGYEHGERAICPVDMKTLIDLRCTCKPEEMRGCSLRFKKAIQGLL